MLKIKQADHKDVAFGVHNLDLGFCIVLGSRIRMRALKLRTHVQHAYACNY